MLLFFYSKVEETVSPVMVRDQTVLFVLIGITAASQSSRAVDKPAPSGILVLLHAVKLETFCKGFTEMFRYNEVQCYFCMQPMLQHFNVKYLDDPKISQDRRK